MEVLGHGSVKFVLVSEVRLIFSVLSVVINLSTN